MICENILETIGNTPLVKLHKVVTGIPGTILAKVETFNPGHSTKDRMALKMIEDAEKSGVLKPGGTIIEGTSGNTGMGLAIAAVVKGYKCIFTTTDKQSKEKVDALRALGAEVIVCPTNVEPEDPKSYYSVSSRLVNEVPNSWKPNQYDNPSNAKAHYESTGPEIWQQTEGKVTHFVVGVGTGGTISGVAKYLKEQNPDIKVWGIDTYGSVFKTYKETGIFDKNEIYPYITEGIGEDFLPENVDFSLIDLFEKVTDKDAAIYTRKIAREDGIFVGNSAGAVIAGIHQLKHLLKPTDVMVVLFHDHGTRYLGKMFNDDWMRDRGFMVKERKTALDLIKNRLHLPLVTVLPTQTIAQATLKLVNFKISQLPVIEGTEVLGSINDTDLLSKMLMSDDIKNKPVSEIMGKPFPVVSPDTDIEKVAALITKENPAVLIKMDEGYQIVTIHDIIDNIAQR